MEGLGWSDQLSAAAVLCITKRVIGMLHVAFMSRGVAGSDWEPLELKENMLQHVQHEKSAEHNVSRCFFESTSDFDARGCGSGGRIPQLL